MVEADVLKFGEFTLKSGRKSPFFMNAGAYVTGSQLKRLGQYYAKAIYAKYGDDFDVLFHIYNLLFVIKNSLIHLCLFLLCYYTQLPTKNQPKTYLSSRSKASVTRHFGSARFILI